MKKCSKCGEEKERSLFRVNNSAKDGLTSACSDCLYTKKEKPYKNDDFDAAITVICGLMERGQTLSAKEIADIIGINSKVIYNLEYRAIEKLRKHGIDNHRDYFKGDNESHVNYGDVISGLTLWHSDKTNTEDLIG